MIKILKKDIKYILMSFVFSCVLFIILFMNHSTPLSLAISILFMIFFNITFIYKDRFNPFTFLAISLLIGILDVVFVALNIRIVDSSYPISIYVKTLFMIIVWLICFSIPFLIKFKNKNINGKTKKNKMLNYISQNTNIKVLLLIFTIIYLYVVYKIIITIMDIGISSAIINSAVFRYNNQGYLATLLSLSSIIPICLFELKKDKIGYLAILFMFIILLLTGRRGLIITTLILPILLYLHYRKKNITNGKVFVVGIFCIIIIMVLGALRNANSYIESSNKYVEMLSSITISTQLGENLPDTINAIDTGRVQLSRFKYLGNGFVGLIPRKIWANKPELIDHSMIISNEIYNITDYGRPVGPYGFAYFCFGWTGVILSALFSGLITKRFYCWMRVNESFISIFLYSILVNYVINIIKPESIMNIIALYLIVYFATFTSQFVNKIKIR